MFYFHRLFLPCALISNYKVTSLQNLKKRCTTYKVFIKTFCNSKGNLNSTHCVKCGMFQLKSQTNIGFSYLKIIISEKSE